MKSSLVLSRVLALSAGAGLFAAAAPAPAAESYDSCAGIIGALPAVIATQGTWCLDADRSTALTSGAAIEITANNVTIDCNGFKLGGLSAGAGTATVGILANTRTNLTVRNCHVRGFRSGVQLNGEGIVVEDNRFEANTQRGVTLSGERNAVRRNLVTDTGGSTIGTGLAYGIVATGTTDIADNTISGVTARTGTNQGAWGIYVAGPGADSAVENNRVRHVLRDGTGPSAAIRSVASGRTTVIGNSLFGTGVGAGVQCANENGAVTGNSVLAFGTALVGCSDDGGNVVKP
jgi:hypothetical protein